MIAKYNLVLGIATVEPIQERTVFPSHVVRQAAFDRSARPGEQIDAFLMRQRREFEKSHNVRRWNGDMQGRFDRYLEELK